MPVISVKFEGINELQKKLGVFSERIVDELNTAIMKAGYLIEAESKPMTPVRTGRLRASITTDLQSLKAIIAPHTEYAIFVHEGTRRMKSRPFMKWGLQRANPKLKEIFKKAVDNALNG